MRYPSIDLLRVVVVCVIVWRHTYPGGDDQLLLSTVAVPFFFFLTGWLWRPGKRDLLGEAKNRWGTLGRPYLSWLAILTVALIISAVAADEFSGGILLGPVLGGSFATRPFTTFWFFSALFTTAVLMRVLDRARPWVLVTVMVVALAAGSIAGEHFARIPLAIGTGAASIGFALAGRVLAQAAPKPSTKRSIAAAVLLPTAALLSIPFDHIDLKQGLFGTPFVSAAISVVCAWAAIVLLDHVFARMPATSDALSRALPPLAKVAVVVVLLHPGVLWALNAPTSSAPWWVFLCALLLPWGIAVLLGRSALSPWLLGQPRRGSAEPRAVLDRRRV